MESKEDRRIHISGGSQTNSPITGTIEGDVAYVNLTINISSEEIQSVVQQIKRTPEKELQIQGSSDKVIQNTNILDLKGMEAVINMITNAVKRKEGETGVRVEQIRTNDDVRFSRKELLIKEALIEGYNYVSMGRYNEAISSYDKVLAINPDHAVALNNKAYILQGTGRYNDALFYLDKSLAINPDNDAALQNKAFLLFKEGRYNDALFYLDKSLAINPNDGHPWNLKAMVFISFKLYSEALTCVDRALSINPKNPYPWANKSTILHHLGNATEAKQCFARAIQLGLSG